MHSERESTRSPGASSSAGDGSCCVCCGFRLLIALPDRLSAGGRGSGPEAAGSAGTRAAAATADNPTALLLLWWSDTTAGMPTWC
eukprot:233210-Chlamydomonas_euryale.AAC.2